MIKFPMFKIKLRKKKVRKIFISVRRTNHRVKTIWLKINQLASSSSLALSKTRFTDVTPEVCLIFSKSSLVLEKAQSLGKQTKSITHHLEVFLMDPESSLLQLKPITSVVHNIRFFVLIYFFLRRTRRKNYSFSLGTRL